MINATYYNKRNLVQALLGGKVKHFAAKYPSVTVQWYTYTLEYGENIYKVTEKVFGKGMAYMWPYIADNNRLRIPDEWKAGDKIKLPKLIIKESNTEGKTYASKSDTTTV